MENYTIDKAYAVLASIDSMGSQVKFYKDGYWFKYDCLGVEGLAEEIVSMLLSCSNITDYVFYEQCMINGKRGCKSADFLDRDEQFISFQALYKNAAGKELAEAIRGLQSADARAQMLLDFIRETTKLDATAYLYQNLALDMLTRNPDRHFGNLGVILQTDGTFRFAPIFDNGQGLTMNFTITPPILEDEEKEERLFAATLSGSFEAQFLAIDSFYYGEKLSIDYSRLDAMLMEHYPKGNLAVSFLRKSLDKYKGLFPNLSSEPQNDKTIEDREYEDYGR